MKLLRISSWLARQSVDRYGEDIARISFHAKTRINTRLLGRAYFFINLELCKRLFCQGLFEMLCKVLRYIHLSSRAHTSKEMLAVPSVLGLVQHHEIKEMSCACRNYSNGGLALFDVCVCARACVSRLPSSRTWCDLP